MSKTAWPSVIALLALAGHAIIQTIRVSELETKLVECVEMAEVAAGGLHDCNQGLRRCVLTTHVLAGDQIGMTEDQRAAAAQQLRELDHE